MNQYKAAGADRSSWLSMWSSTPVLVDRKSSATVHVVRPVVPILAGLQPEMLTELRDENSRDDGLLDRMLFAQPPSPPVKWVDATCSHGLRESWARTVLTLLSRELCLDNGRPVPEIRPFSDVGRKAWIEMYNEHAGEMNGRDLPPQLLGPYSKLSSYAARFALILNETRAAEAGAVTDGPAVDDGTVYAAWALVDYFKEQQRGVFGLLAQTPEDRLLTKVLRWLRLRGGEGTLRELVRSNVAGITTTAGAREAARGLDARGWAELSEQKNDRARATTLIRVVEEVPGNVG